MKPKAIPDRWLEYNACGRVIEGTRLICFKVPLRKEVQVNEPSITQLWDIPAVLAEIPRLTAVIDLTNTARYYDPKEFLARNVLHKKILMPGRMIPPESKVREFMDAVDEFLGRDCDSLVGVHCTHGLNRTGYMVCRYMRDRLGIAAPEAIKRFETARGYKIERDVYINGILNEKAELEHEGKVLNHLRRNKVIDEVPIIDDQPNEYNYHKGGIRRFNNMPPKDRQFDANRDRSGRYNPYARQPYANRGHLRSTSQGPSRSFNNDGFSRRYNNNSRNNDERPNHLSTERNQFGSNKVLDEVPVVNDQPNRYSHHRGGIQRFKDSHHRGGIQRLNNIPPRNRQFDESFASQPPFANRGRTLNTYPQEPSRSFNDDGFNREYNNNLGNNDNRYPSSSGSSRPNHRFTPYHRGPYHRGPYHRGNFRGNGNRRNNERYDGGANFNPDRNRYNKFGTSTDNNWRKRDNRSTLRNLDSDK